MAALVDGGGARLDLLVQRGTDMPSVDLAFTNDDGTPVDFTGCTLIARATTRSDVPEDMNLEAVFVDAAEGLAALDLASEEIEKMSTGANTSSKPRVAGGWTLALQTASGTVTPLFYGEIVVRAQA